MSGQYLKILLIEDNPGDARLVQEMLSQVPPGNSGTGFKVVHISRLQQVIEKISEESFDVILLDLSLPDSHGLVTLQRTLDMALGIPIVVLSGQSDDAVIFEAVKVGAQDYLVKGYLNEYSLPRTILYAIERKQIEAEIRQRNRELALLNQVIAASVDQAEPEAILNTACRELAIAFDMTQSAAVLINQDRTTLEIVAEYRPEDRSSLLYQMLPLADNPLILYIIDHQAPLVANDAQNDPRLEPIYPMLRLRGTVSLLLLPLMIEGDVIGAISLGATEKHSLSSQDVNLAWSVADQIAGALARARLNQERQLLNAAIEQTAECIIVTDTNGTILYVNPAFEQITGYGKHETVGQNPRMLNSGEQEEDFFQEMWTTISTGQVWEGQLVNKKKDGSFYTADSTITPVQDKHGQIINYVAVQRDVTLELESQEQYRQAQKMEAIGRLAGGIAHDFNNLLTIIMGNTELVVATHGDNTQLINDMEQIGNAAERASALTRQLLAFSRKQIVKPKTLNLNQIVTDLGKMLHRLLGEHINLHIVPDENLGYVKADESQIEQIIMNLAVNARDAMPRGGQLSIETANVYLDENYAAHHLNVHPGMYIMLAVTDTGHGMNPEIRAKIFEPFFTTKNQDKGTGLGLATVYGIVEQSDGHIWVYSEPGHGTTFKVYLPQVSPPDMPVASKPAVSSSSSGSETILLAEDDEMVRDLAQRILSDNGYTVLEAGNAPEALICSQNHQGTIDLLITDMIMPGGMTGNELAEQLTTTHKNIKTLYISGYTDNGLVQQGLLLEGSSNDYLQKPFTLITLTQKVRELLDK